MDITSWEDFREALAAVATSFGCDEDLLEQSGQISVSLHPGFYQPPSQPESVHPAVVPSGYNPLQQNAVGLDLASELAICHAVEDLFIRSTEIRHTRGAIASFYDSVLPSHPFPAHNTSTKQREWVWPFDLHTSHAISAARKRPEAELETRSPTKKPPDRPVKQKGNQQRAPKRLATSTKSSTVQHVENVNIDHLPTSAAKSGELCLLCGDNLLGQDVLPQLWLSARSILRTLDGDIEVKSDGDIDLPPHIVNDNQVALWYSLSALQDPIVNRTIKLTPHQNNQCDSTEAQASVSTFPPDVSQSSSSVHRLCALWSCCLTDSLLSSLSRTFNQSQSSSISHRSPRTIHTLSPSSTPPPPTHPTPTPMEGLIHHRNVSHIDKHLISYIVSQNSSSPVKCIVCNKPGATIKCASPNCARQYHLPCAIHPSGYRSSDCSLKLNRLTVRWDLVSRVIYCQTHKDECPPIPTPTMIRTMVLAYRFSDLGFIAQVYKIDGAKKECDENESNDLISRDHNDDIEKADEDDKPSQGDSQGNAVCIHGTSKTGARKGGSKGRRSEYVRGRRDKGTDDDASREEQHVDTQGTPRKRKLSVTNSSAREAGENGSKVAETESEPPVKRRRREETVELAVSKKVVGKLSQKDPGMGDLEVSNNDNNDKDETQKDILREKSRNGDSKSQVVASLPGGLRGRKVKGSVKGGQTKSDGSQVGTMEVRTGAIPQAEEGSETKKKKKGSVLEKYGLSLDLLSDTVHVTTFHHESHSGSFDDDGDGGDASSRKGGSNDEGTRASVLVDADAMAALDRLFAQSIIMPTRVQPKSNQEENKMAVSSTIDPTSSSPVLNTVTALPQGGDEHVMTHAQSGTKSGADALPTSTHNVTHTVKTTNPLASASNTMDSASSISATEISGVSPPQSATLSQEARSDNPLNISTMKPAPEPPRPQSSRLSLADHAALTESATSLLRAPKWMPQRTINSTQRAPQSNHLFRQPLPPPPPPHTGSSLANTTTIHSAPKFLFFTRSPPLPSPSPSHLPPMSSLHSHSANPARSLMSQSISSPSLPRAPSLLLRRPLPTLHSSQHVDSSTSLPKAATNRSSQPSITPAPASTSLGIKNHSIGSISTTSHVLTSASHPPSISQSTSLLSSFGSTTSPPPTISSSSPPPPSPLSSLLSSSPFTIRPVPSHAPVFLSKHLPSSSQQTDNATSVPSTSNVNS